MYAHRARQLGAKDAAIDHWVLESFFSTMTNVNFDDSRFVADLNALEGTFSSPPSSSPSSPSSPSPPLSPHPPTGLITKAKAMYEQACAKKGVKPENLGARGQFALASKTDVNALVEQAKTFSIPTRQAKLGLDYVGLQELTTYGLKGMCAYAEHARVLGWEKEEIYAFVHKTLDFLTREDATVDELVAAALEVGKMNYTVMALLDESNTSRYGHPEPTKVRMTAKKGKGILVSGHDLGDLEAILKQTEGKGINVYTHGELLPANSYPELKKYKHLAGNYGGAWQNQKIDFATFEGPIVMTTNCIIEPMRAYKDRIYTRSVVGWPGVKHLPTMDFSAVVQKALEMDGFDADEPERTNTIGFGRNTVMSVAPTVIEAVKAGHLKHFFLIGGCDGTEGERFVSFFSFFSSPILTPPSAPTTAAPPSSPPRTPSSSPSAAPSTASTTLTSAPSPTSASLAFSTWASATTPTPPSRSPSPSPTPSALTSTPSLSPSSSPGSSRRPSPSSSPFSPSASRTSTSAPTSPPSSPPPSSTFSSRTSA